MADNNVTAAARALVLRFTETISVYPEVDALASALAEQDAASVEPTPAGAGAGAGTTTPPAGDGTGTTQ